MFEEEVLRSRLPVVVDFYSGGCPPCEAVSPILDELAAEFEGRVRFVRVNMDDDEAQSRRLAAKLALSSVPTVLYVSGGEVGGRTVGVAPAAEFRRRAEALADGDGLDDSCTQPTLGE